MGEFDLRPNPFKPGEMMRVMRPKQSPLRPPTPIEPGCTFDLFARATLRAADPSAFWGRDRFLLPPDDSDYRSYGPSPKNALPFLSMCVDGVHWTLLAVDGAVREDSPVIRVSPMDFSDPHAVEAPSFMDWIRPATGPDRDELIAALDRERAGGDALSPHLAFSGGRGERPRNRTADRSGCGGGRDFGADGRRGRIPPRRLGAASRTNLVAPHARSSRSGLTAGFGVRPILSNGSFPPGLTRP